MKKRAIEDKEIREAFKAHSKHVDIKQLRFAAFYASVAFMSFAFLDWLVFPELFYFFLKLRLAVVAYNIIVYIFTLNQKSYKYSYAVKLLSYILYILVLLVMIYFTGGYSSPYYVGLFIALVGFIYLLPLDNFSAAVISMIILISYFTIGLITLNTSSDYNVFYNNLFFLVSFIILILFSTFFLNKNIFKEYIAKYNLSKVNKELRAIDSQKMEFFTNINHEIRTPLTSIIAPLQSLIQGDAGSFNTDQKELLDLIHRNTIKLLDLINQVLDISKLNQSKLTLRLIKINITNYTKDVISLFREVAARKNISMTFISRNTEDLYIYIDYYQYERILTNLIRNSIKFTETGGITIETKLHGKSFILSVTDTGIGIPENSLEKIFKRFEQVNNNNTGIHGGTGLGLAIVETAVKILHGKIDVKSVLGIGTVFTVTLPVNLEELEPDALYERRKIENRLSTDNKDFIERRKDNYSKIPIEELTLAEQQSYAFSKYTENNFSSKSESSNKYRILLTEDNGDLRFYISKMLRKMNYSVTVTANGKEALEILNNDKIDLLVTDISMPELDGCNLIEKIRDSEHLKNLPIIVMTARSDEDTKLKALGIGADMYLPKPINIRELDARIKNLLTTRELVKAAAETAMLDRRINELRMSFAQTLTLRDAETGNHSKEVLEIGTSIAKQIGIKEDQILMDSLLLHDIGKIGIPDNILLKKTSLTKEEKARMDEHPLIGKKLLESFSNFKDVADIIFAHQEHWDGSGYPRGLKGEEIPLIARIIAVADAFHAMTNTRPYRQAMREEEAINELKKNSGTQFDPKMVEAFLKAKGYSS